MNSKKRMINIDKLKCDVYSKLITSDYLKKIHKRFTKILLSIPDDKLKAKLYDGYVTARVKGKNCWTS